MEQATLPLIYSDYITYLNERDWTRLGDFVDTDVVHNGFKLGLTGYRGMLEQNVRDIPDLRFETELLVVQPPQIGSRMKFDCRPARSFFDLPINGRRVIFYENVFYRFDRSRIVQVCSIVGKAAIEAQLGA